MVELPQGLLTNSHNNVKSLIQNRGNIAGCSTGVADPGDRTVRVVSLEFCQPHYLAKTFGPTQPRLKRHSHSHLAICDILVTYKLLFCNRVC